MSTEKIRTLLTIFISAFAFLSIQSIFNDDSTRIISKEGEKILFDEKEMNSLRKKIDHYRNNSKHSSEIIIQL